MMCIKAGRVIARPRGHTLRRSGRRWRSPVAPTRSRAGGVHTCVPGSQSGAPGEWACFSAHQLPPREVLARRRWAGRPSRPPSRACPGERRGVLSSNPRVFLVRGWRVTAFRPAACPAPPWLTKPTSEDSVPSPQPGHLPALVLPGTGLPASPLCRPLPRWARRSRKSDVCDCLKNAHARDLLVSGAGELAQLRGRLPGGGSGPRAGRPPAVRAEPPLLVVGARSPLMGRTARSTGTWSGS